jgi:hypothetical protein
MSDMDRREFLKKLGRIAAFGGLSLLGAKALKGYFSAGEPLKNQACRSDGICPRCPVLDACGHPQALSLKNEKGRT